MRIYKPKNKAHVKQRHKTRLVTKGCNSKMLIYRITHLLVRNYNKFIANSN